MISEAKRVVPVSVQIIAKIFPVCIRLNYVDNSQTSVFKSHFKETKYFHPRTPNIKQSMKHKQFKPALSKTKFY